MSINSSEFVFISRFGLIKDKKGFIKKNIKCDAKSYYCMTIDFDKKNKHSLISCSYYEVMAEYLYENKY